MAYKIKKPSIRRVPTNICRPKGKKSGDYYIYDALTGWRILASETVVAPQYSGIDGLLVHKSYCYGPTQFYKPWPELAVEQPIPRSRVDHENTDDWGTLPTYANYNFRSVITPRDEL